MAKGITMLADTRRNEHVQKLRDLSDRDLCEMVRAHFESHPTLPGEKVMKDQANQVLAQFESRPANIDEMTEGQKAETQRFLSSKQSLSNDGFEPVTGPTPFDNDNILSSEEREELVQKYAQTRIRETSLKEGNYYLDFRHFNPMGIKRESIGEVDQKNGSDVYSVQRATVELQRNDVGEVHVVAPLIDGGYMTVGSLPDKFLKNNPMNVEYCEAEMQIVDYSNGMMKNVSAAVVVDTDLMSGNVVDLDEDILAGLDQTNGLEQ